MATLNDSQLSEVRRAVSSERPTVDYTKAQINAAVQAIEDYFETTARSGLNTAINGATQPLGITLTNGQKQALVKFYLRQKFERGG